MQTNGYVGFGISPNGNMNASDVVIGWVKDGQTYFSVSHTSCYLVDPNSGIFPKAEKSYRMWLSKYYMSQRMRFPTMWYVRPAKSQISLRIRAV